MCKIVALPTWATSIAPAGLEPTTLVYKTIALPLS